MATSPQAIVDAIDAAFLKMAEGDLIIQYKIGTKTVEKSIAEALEIRKYFVQLANNTTAGAATNFAQFGLIK